jgi:hypothetical protein
MQSVVVEWLVKVTREELALHGWVAVEGQAPLAVMELPRQVALAGMVLMLIPLGQVQHQRAIAVITQEVAVVPLIA